jgi:hypothetical protein
LGFLLLRKSALRKNLTLLSFKDLMSSEEYHEVIEENTILTLTDESDKSKLLGVQVDMDYDK